MAEAKEIEIHGRRIYYEESGPGGEGASGEPLVLVHGWTGSSFDWRLVAPALSGGRRVFALDQVGFGRSDKPRIEYTIENFVEYLDEFVDLLGLGRVHLAGNSMGGHIVCEYALSYPAKVKSLVLIDGSGVRMKLPFFYRLARLPGLLEFFLARTTLESYTKLMKRRGPYYDKSIITDELVRGHMNSFVSKEGVHAAADSLRRNLGKVDLEDRLGQIQVPVLVIWGRQDQTLPVALAFKTHRKLPNSRLVIFDECGHLPMEEKPADCAREMIDFLEKT